MIDVWFSAWGLYHGYIMDDDSGLGRLRTYRFTEPGDTRNVWQSLAEFDDALTSWIGSRNRLTWRVRPRWTPRFTIECELAADYDARAG